MNRVHATREAWQPQTKQDRDTILRELQEVLASPHFCNSKRYPTLLQYIVENTLAGKLELLKERTLGVEVFDRPPTYDTNTDTVVRYTAGEVRKRLLLYYSEHNSGSGVRISLPAGSYVAEFLHGHEEPSDEADIHGTYPHDADSQLHVGSETHELGPGSLLGIPDDAVRPLAGSTPARNRSAFTRLLWPVLIVVAVAAVGTGAWWRYRATDPQTTVDVFWSPVMRDQRTLIVCTGSSVFAPQNYSGVQTAGKDIDYTFVSMQIASGIAQISSAMGHSGVAIELAPSATMSLPDLREHSITLLGGYNNQWTLRLLRPLRYHFVEDQGTAEIIVDGTQPRTHWERDSSLPYSSADDYGLIARFRDPTIDGWVMVLAGLGRNGTEAAAQFATSPHYMELLKDRVGSGGFANQNIEAILKVSVIDGKTGAPSILAVHTW